MLAPTIAAADLLTADQAARGTLSVLRHALAGGITVGSITVTCRGGALHSRLLVWPRPDAARRDVNAAYRWAPHDALERNGVEMPFPQRDLHVRSRFGLDGATARDAWRSAAAANRDSGPAAAPPMELKGRQAHGQHD